MASTTSLKYGPTISFFPRDYKKVFFLVMGLEKLKKVSLFVEQITLEKLKLKDIFGEQMEGLKSWVV